MEQQRYQVRFDWGAGGGRAVAADADVVVWVDALDPVDPAGVVARPDAALVATGLATAAAAAQWVLALQHDLGRRCMIAVLAAGRERNGAPAFAVDDLLAAGAVIAALVDLGIDATSPEAAAAETAYRGLERAVGHLLTAAAGAGAVPREARRLDPALTAADVRVLRDHASRRPRSGFGSL